uniref:ZZ-type domain-containing protein n=1 Tax=Macrostomum lignano TaxID=282301 RepID=A0A1I8FHD5_9PLAT
QRQQRPHPTIAIPVLASAGAAVPGLAARHAPPGLLGAVPAPRPLRLMQSHPMRGLRYKCLKCFNLSLCQQCFFTGREYVQASGQRRDGLRSLSRALRCRLRLKRAAAGGGSAAGSGGAAAAAEWPGVDGGADGAVGSGAGNGWPTMGHLPCPTRRRRHRRHRRHCCLPPPLETSQLTHDTKTAGERTGNFFSEKLVEGFIILTVAEAPHRYRMAFVIEDEHALIASYAGTLRLRQGSPFGAAAAEQQVDGSNQVLLEQQLLMQQQQLAQLQVPWTRADRIRTQPQFESAECGFYSTRHKSASTSSAMPIGASPLPMALPPPQTPQPGALLPNGGNAAAGLLPPLPAAAAAWGIHSRSASRGFPQRQQRRQLRRLSTAVVSSASAYSSRGIGGSARAVAGSSDVDYSLHYSGSLSRSNGGIRRAGSGSTGRTRARRSVGQVDPSAPWFAMAGQCGSTRWPAGG